MAADEGESARVEAEVSPGIRDAVAPLARTGATISYHPQTGRVNFIGTVEGQAISSPMALPVVVSREDAARGFLTTYGSAFGLLDQSRELVPMVTKELERGRAKVRFQQVYNNIPVFGGELIVQLNARNSVQSAIGEVLPDISLSTTPTISADLAAQVAVNMTARWHEEVTAADLTATTPELWIYNPVLVGPDKGPTVLVWRMEVQSGEGAYPVRELVLIDAQRGSIALHFSQLHEAKSRRTHTYTYGVNTQLPGTLACTESNPTCSGASALTAAAHIYAGHTYDYYFNNFGRDSLNNAGMTLVSSVVYGFNYNNAGWTGTQMIYGDVKGFANADDVVGHELTHGVVQYEANLYYYYQSGAINESFADVFGEFVDLTNGSGNDSPAARWLVGEDVTEAGVNPPAGQIRNMKNPPAFQNPDKMTSPLYRRTDLDNGWVHYNSGVNNKAAYLIVDGTAGEPNGQFNGRTVTGIGITKASEIYYWTLTNLLTAGSDYNDLYNALYQACLDRIGIKGITMSDCQQVRTATMAVEMNLQPVADFNTDAPLCDADRNLKSTVFFDNLENGMLKWVTGSHQGSNHWRLGAASDYYFPHSGLNFLYASNAPSDSADTYVAMSNSVAIPADAYLHFAHAYDFEDPNYDGGVLEYTINNGLSWVRVSAFDYNGYDGPLSSNPTYANPLGGQSAWIGNSHGYISSRVNLSSLEGENVRFRWRMAIDNYGLDDFDNDQDPNDDFDPYDRGWWLDDVSIYSCASAAPENDEIANAVLIDAVPYAMSQSVDSATFADDEPIPSCVGNIEGTVWYRYTANAVRTLSLNTTDSDYDTVAAVWTRDGIGTMNEIACNDDFNGQQTSRITFQTEASTTYYFQIGAYSDLGSTLNFNLIEPPINDAFDNAILFTTVPYLNSQGTVEAQIEENEQTPSCVSQIASTVWYAYTAAADGDLVFNTVGSNYHSILAVWSGDTLGSLTEVGCRAFDVMTNGYPFTLNAVAGTTYYIQIGGFPAPFTTTGTLQFSVKVPPANDAFAKATSIPAVPYTTTQSTVNATAEQSEQMSIWCPSLKNTVWYSYTAVNSGSLVVSTAGSDYDTAVIVWTGNTLGNLTEKVCNNNNVDETSLLTMNAVAGTTYYIQIGSSAEETGNLSLSVEETTGPSNDNLASALPIATLPFITTQSSIGATVEGAEQLPSCGPTIQSTVWYTYIAAANGVITFNTSGSSFDTVIAVWTGAAPASLTQVTCSDNSGSPISQVVVNATAGTRYYIQLGGIAGGGGTGSAGTVLNLVAAVLPSNDTFATAQVVPSVPYSRAQSTVGAWQETNEPLTPCGSPIGASVWYKYTAPTTRTITFSTLGATFDAQLVVWRGTNIGSLTHVICNNGTGNDAVVSVNTVAATTYYIMIAGTNGAYGDVTLQAYLNNDYFSNAVPTGNLIVSLPYIRRQSTDGTTLEANEKPGTCGVSVANTVWYKYTAPVTAPVIFSTTGSDFNTVLSVWTGSTLANLAQVACNDDGVNTPTSSVTVNTVATKTYYIRLGGSVGSYGALTFNADIVPPATAAPPRNYYTTPTPTLTWNRITWATTYEIQVDDTSNFAAPLIFTTIVSGDTLSVTTAALTRGQYYWRVCAKGSNNVCGASNWSVADSFLVDVP